jgi:hypothetical protein
MSGEHEPDSKLALRAESLARALELREPDWDAFERRVTERLASAPAADETLLASPLPELEEERRARSGAEPRESVSLADLARATVAKRAENEAASVAKESLALASQKRAQVERIGERKPNTAARATVAAATPEAQPPKATTARPNVWDSRGPWLGVAIAAVGLAASFGLYFAGQRTDRVVVTQPVLTSAPVAATSAPRLAKDATPSAGEAEERRGNQPAPATSAGALAALDPEASPPNADEPTSEVRAERPSAAKSAPAKAERVVLDEARPAGPAAPKAAAKPQLRPAELKPLEGISDRPSTGAAQAAVGAVLGAARACLAGQTAPSSATLVFGSDGEVDSVRVTGGAAGTPAAACVESALRKARVQPFAAPSFSLGVTVRPL